MRFIARGQSFEEFLRKKGTESRFGNTANSHDTNNTMVFEFNSKNRPMSITATTNNTGFSRGPQQPQQPPRPNSISLVLASTGNNNNLNNITNDNNTSLTSSHKEPRDLRELLVYNWFSADFDSIIYYIVYKKSK